MRVVGKYPVKSPYCSRTVSVHCYAPNGERLASTNHQWIWEFRTSWLSCYSELAGFCCVNSVLQERKTAKNVAMHEVKWSMGHLIIISIIIGTKLLFSIDSSAKAIKLYAHFQVHVMYAFWTSFRAVKWLLANSHFLSEHWLPFMHHILYLCRYTN